MALELRLRLPSRLSNIFHPRRLHHDIYNAPSRWGKGNVRHTNSKSSPHSKSSSENFEFCRQHEQFGRSSSRVQDHSALAHTNASESILLDLLPLVNSDRSGPTPFGLGKSGESGEEAKYNYGHGNKKPNRLGGSDSQFKVRCRIARQVDRRAKDPNAFLT